MSIRIFACVCVYAWVWSCVLHVYACVYVYTCLCSTRLAESYMFRFTPPAKQGLRVQTCACARVFKHVHVRVSNMCMCACSTCACARVCAEYDMSVWVCGWVNLRLSAVIKSRGRRLAHTPTQAHTHTHTHTHTYIYIYIYINIYIYIYIYIVYFCTCVFFERDNVSLYIFRYI